MTIILRDRGIDRHYPCNSMNDAIVLFDALCKTGKRVEMWEADKHIQTYDPLF